MRRRFWTEGAGSFVLAVVLALIIRWAFMEAYVIPSSSMLPTLLVHDHIFVNKIVYGLRLPFTERWLKEFSQPERGEVVVFKYPEDKGQFFIKRVIGIPGDRVFYENGNLYINDQLIDKTLPVERSEDGRWIRDEDFPGEINQGGKSNYVHWQEKLGGHTYSVLLRRGDHLGISFGPYTVPPDHIFVMGDNRDNSQDSRAWDANASRAIGMATFQRVGTGTGSLKIPAGTVLRASTSGNWPQAYRTTKEAELKDGSIQVPIQAVEPGVLGNIHANVLNIVDGPLADQLSVSNSAALTGGDDKRFVPRDYLVGRATLVWLSCEKTLPVATFLCNPFETRWSRFLHPIQ